MAQQTKDIFNRAQSTDDNAAIITRSIVQPTPEAREWASANRLNNAQAHIQPQWPIDPDTNADEGEFVN